MVEPPFAWKLKTDWKKQKPPPARLRGAPDDGFKKGGACIGSALSSSVYMVAQIEPGFPGSNPEKIRAFRVKTGF